MIKAKPQLKAIVFDFDGVICESVGVKIDAFRRLFSQYPQHLNSIMDYHIRNGGISRFVKFKKIYSDILKQPLTDLEMKKLGEQFTLYTFEEVVNSPFVEGIEDFWKKFDKKLAMFIVSGTPEEEMRQIVTRKGIGQHFQAVYGSPRKKGELINLILSENSWKKSEIVFVGDSINDYDGAKEAGVRFVGRINKEFETPFDGVFIADTILNNFDLTQFIESEYT